MISVPRITFKVTAVTRLLILSAFFTIVIPFVSLGQLRSLSPTPGETSRKTSESDTLKKRFGRSALFWGISQGVPYTYDRFITHQDYAQTTFHSIAHNLNPGNWEFDNDIFQTNQFGHPYQGSYFYNSFRVNGYNFWQSAPAAFAGSLTWELAGENQASSPNDLINTTFGGIVLGEMEYRLSNKIINNQSVGFKRQASEVIGFLVDPLNGLNRIIDGKWGKVYGKPNEHDSTKIFATFSGGLRSVNRHSEPAGWYGHVRLLYGTPDENYRTPFSNIAVNLEVGKDDTSAVNNISVYGSLAGWEIKSTEKTLQLAILSANYDYIRNEAFFYGGQSVKINWLSEYDISKKFKINTNFGLGGVLLGAVPDRYLYRGRSYDFGSGASYNGGIEFDLGDKLFYNINYRGALLETINGNASHSLLHTVSSELRYAFSKKISFSAEPGYFTLHSYFKDHSSTVEDYPFIKVALNYSLQL